MKHSERIWWLLGCLFVLLSIWGGLRITRRITFASRPPGPSLSPGMSQKCVTDLGHLWQLWQKREQQDISQQLLPYVNSTEARVQRFAVRALAKLESPAAEKVISSAPVRYSASIMQLAVARIRSRNLKGQDKLEFIIRESGFSWSELADCLRMGDFYRLGSKGITANEVIEELVDVVHSMGKRGETVNGLLADIQLNDVQN